MSAFGQHPADQIQVLGACLTQQERAASPPTARRVLTWTPQVARHGSTSRHRLARPLFVDADRAEPLGAVRESRSSAPEGNCVARVN